MTEPSPSSTTTATRKPNLRGVSAIRAYFRRNTTPIYFVSPTPFNLLGVDRWISNFHYVNYYDSFDGTHPHVFLPRERGVDDFGSMEEMNNFLLGHPEFAEFAAEQGPGGKAVLVMVDDTTERLAAERGIDVALPPAALRHRLDSKLVTTRLGNEAGVPSVPNVLGSVADYDSLLDLAAHGGLGTDLVVQLPWGDSGKTTFFINSRESWDQAAAEHELTGVELKVMKRINCRPLAVEAVLTRHGTLVGPLMSDITGHPELTPYKGGWAGNDVYLDVLDETQRSRARILTQNLGNRLANEGYRGFFEVDYLVDVDTGELYLGELNPRLSGISSMTNVTAGAYAELPLFLFHLLEYLDVDYEIDVDEINAAVGRPRHGRRVEPGRHQAHRRRDRRDRRRACHGDLADRPRRGPRVRPRGHRLARPDVRLGEDHGLLPARLRPRRLPLQGRRHRDPGQPRAAAVRPARRSGRAHPAVQAVDRRDPQPGAGDTVARHADPGRGRRHEVAISEGRRARAAAGRGRAW